jgi:hypothetical protein
LRSRAAITKSSCSIQIAVSAWPAVRQTEDLAGRYANWHLAQIAESRKAIIRRLFQPLDGLVRIFHQRISAGDVISRVMEMTKSFALSMASLILSSARGFVRLKLRARLADS